MNTLYIGLIVYGVLALNNVLVKSAGKYVTKNEWFRVLGFGLFLSAGGALMIDLFILK